MPGQQAAFAVRGAQNEDAAQQIIGRIAAYSKVKREQDYGIDFYCQVREPTGPAAFGVSDLFAMQVKGADDLVYGGKNERGEWKAYEIHWLRTLAVPLYLARVDPSLLTIELFSLGPVWRVLWYTNPFQIRCVTRPATSTPFTLADATQEPVPGNEQTSAHDGTQWTVDLGPPFLRLSSASLNDESFAASVVDCLRMWIHVDRMSLIRFQLRVAIINNIFQWHTNDFSQFPALNRAMFWSSDKGQNISDLAPLAAEVLVNLGANLQWQNDRGAYFLIEALEYLDGIGVVDEMGKGLIDGLKKTRALGKGPKEPS